MSIHDGHRRRIKERFLKYGLDTLQDHEVLELLLCYSIPRGDVNPAAHRLIERFGSLSAVFDAPPAELMKVEGVGKNTASLIKLLPHLFRRYAISHASFENIITDTESAGRYILPRFYGLTEERICVLCMDAKGKVLSCEMMPPGSPNAAAVSVPHIVELALVCRASNVIMAHNHTSGIALPSVEDEQSTAAIAEALGAVGIRLMDHLVVADGDFVSMADNGFFKR